MKLYRVRYFSREYYNNVQSAETVVQIGSPDTEQEPIPNLHWHQDSSTMSTMEGPNAFPLTRRILRDSAVFVPSSSSRARYIAFYWSCVYSRLAFLQFWLPWRTSSLRKKIRLVLQNGINIQLKRKPESKEKKHKIIIYKCI